MTPRMIESLEVGTELSPLVLPRIRRTTLRQYAESSGDRNPLHLDVAAARESGEADVIAHGMLSMAYAGRFLTTRLASWELRTWRLRFTAKTPLAARVTCRGRVIEAGSDEVVVEIHLELEDGTVIATGEARCAKALERTST